LPDASRTEHPLELGAQLRGGGDAELPGIENHFATAAEQMEEHRLLPLPAPEQLLQPVQAIFAQIDGMKRLMVGLLYGAGLRLTECVSLRVKDIDLTYGQIIVRDGKGQRDRATILPAALLPEFQAHLARVKILHDREVALGYGFAPLPFALARKYPAADREWAWQFVFPASRRCIDPRTRKTVRFHIAESTLQRTVKAAVRRIAVSSDRVSSIRMNSFSG